MNEKHGGNLIVIKPDKANAVENSCSNTPNLLEDAFFILGYYTSEKTWKAKTAGQ